MVPTEGMRYQWSNVCQIRVTPAPVQGLLLGGASVVCPVLGDVVLGTQIAVEETRWVEDKTHVSETDHSWPVRVTTTTSHHPRLGPGASE